MKLEEVVVVVVGVGVDFIINNVDLYYYYTRHMLPSPPAPFTLLPKQCPRQHWDSTEAAETVLRKH